MIPDPEITHLGMERGKWPVWAFATERSAALWVCESGDRTVWPVIGMTLGAPLRGEKIPAQNKLVGI